MIKKAKLIIKYIMQILIGIKLKYKLIMEFYLHFVKLMI